MKFTLVPTTSDLFDYYDEVAKENKLTNSYWSYRECEKIHMNDKHPFTGATTLIYGLNWGKLAIVPIEGKRWLDIWKAADKAILESGDCHHTFIEDFINRFDGNLELHTGS